jgi:hypothetical protein
VIETHRNKRLAHLDFKTAMEGGANLEAISVEMVEKVLELTRKYMNTIQGYYYQSESYRCGIELTSGAEALVSVLKYGLHFTELLKDRKIPFDELYKGKWSDA